MFRKFYAALAALVLICSTATGAYAAAPAAIGDEIPHQLAFADQNGAIAEFHALKGEKGLVVFFVRSADWCPFCKKQMQDFAEDYNKFKEAGYEVVSVSYDPVATLKKFSDEKKIPYKMLSDERSQSIAAFGILNDKYEAGSRFFGIPHPTIYVIDADGAITHMFSEDGYKSRPPIAGILRAIE
jgi:peroxiredoxin